MESTEFEMESVAGSVLGFKTATSPITWHLFRKDDLPKPGVPVYFHFGIIGGDPMVIVGEIEFDFEERTIGIIDDYEAPLRIENIVAWAYVEPLPIEIMGNQWFGDVVDNKMPEYLKKEVKSFL